MCCNCIDTDLDEYNVNIKIVNINKKFKQKHRVNVINN